MVTENHAIYQNDEYTYKENKEVEPSQQVQIQVSEENGHK